MTCYGLQVTYLAKWLVLFFICQLFIWTLFIEVTTASFVVVAVATSNDTASHGMSPAFDAKLIAEVNDIIEEIFLITLNKGWFHQIF